LVEDKIVPVNVMKAAYSSLLTPRILITKVRWIMQSAWTMW